MGFDVYGLEPKSHKGEYFRANIWYWHRLWDFTCELSKGILTDEEMKRGHFNDGVEIDQKRAETIARRLQEACLQRDLYEKEIEDTGKQFESHGQAIVGVVQLICQKTGAEFEPEKCVQRFDWKVVKEFADFCANSGGFQVC